MTGDNTVRIMSFRADADSTAPLSTGGFHPFRDFHRWTEDGRDRAHDRVTPAHPFTDTIDAAADPEMTYVSYEMAAAR